MKKTVSIQHIANIWCFQEEYIKPLEINEAVADPKELQKIK